MAAEYWHIEVLKHLVDLVRRLPKSMENATTKSVRFRTVANQSIPYSVDHDESRNQVFEKDDVQQPHPEVQQSLPISIIERMIHCSDNYAFRIAAELGHVEVLKYLFELTPETKQLQEILRNDDYDLFKIASQNGHLEILKYIAEQTQELEERNRMIHSGNDQVFVSAVKNEHLKLLNYIVELASDETEKNEMFNQLLDNLKKDSGSARGSKVKKSLSFLAAILPQSIPEPIKKVSFLDNEMIEKLRSIRVSVIKALATESPRLEAAEFDRKDGNLLSAVANNIIATLLLNWEKAERLFSSEEEMAALTKALDSGENIAGNASIILPLIKDCLAPLNDNSCNGDPLDKVLAVLVDNFKRPPAQKTAIQKVLDKESKDAKDAKDNKFVGIYDSATKKNPSSEVVSPQAKKVASTLKCCTIF